MKTLKLISLTAIMALMPSAAFAQAPGMAWTWQATKLNHGQCLSRAENAMKNAGFSDDFKVVGTPPDTSTFGITGDYRAAIRCITDEGMIIFLVTGNGPRSSELRKRLVDNF